MGFGIGPYGLSAYGLPADEPETLAPAFNVSSRKIDTQKRFVVASDGGFEPMGDSAQRVYVTTSFALGTEPPFIDDRLEQATRQRVEASLAPLTDVKDPAIELQEVEISDDGAGTTNRSVRFKDKAAVRFERKLPR